jgi:hypothetical protein
MRPPDSWERLQMNGISLGLLGCLLALILPAAARADGASPAEFRENCGVNSAYVCLHLFGRKPSLMTVANWLHAGDGFEKDCTLGDLKRAFETAGLTVSALKSEDLAEVVNLVRPGAAVVLRLRISTGTFSGFHFCVLVGGNQSVVIIDPPHPNRVVKRVDLIRNRWFLNATGEFLVVEDKASSGPRKPYVVLDLARVSVPVVERPRAQPADSGTSPAQNMPTPSRLGGTNPYLLLDSPTVDCGDIPLTVDAVVARLGYSNPGGKTLKITNVRGGCSCFQGADGDMELPPGGHGFVNLRFDKTRLAAGAVEEQMLLESNDPRRPLAEVLVRMFLQDTPVGSDIRLSPLLVCFGRRVSAELASETVNFKFVLPDERQDLPRNLSAEVIGRGLSISPVSDNVELDPDGIVCRLVTYRLSWTAIPPDGRFHDIARFAITRAGAMPQAIDVPVTGDALGPGGP